MTERKIEDCSYFLILQNFLRFLLPPLDTSLKPLKTLVLDLDETLIHSQFEETELASHILNINVENDQKMIYVIERPGMKHFLSMMQQYYELVLFTAGQQEYAEKVIEKIDPQQQYFSHCLYRQHCIQKDCYYIKDLSLLGRNLSDVIIIDNSVECFCLQPANGYLIPSFFDDFQDDELIENIEFFIQLSEVFIFLMKNIQNFLLIQKSLMMYVKLNTERNNLITCQKIMSIITIPQMKQWKIAKKILIRHSNLKFIIKILQKFKTKQKKQRNQAQQKKISLTTLKHFNQINQKFYQYNKLSPLDEDKSQVKLFQPLIIIFFMINQQRIAMLLAILLIQMILAVLQDQKKFRKKIVQNKEFC